MGRRPSTPLRSGLSDETLPDVRGKSEDRLQQPGNRPDRLGGGDHPQSSRCPQRHLPRDAGRDRRGSRRGRDGPRGSCGRASW